MPRTLGTECQGNLPRKPRTNGNGRKVVPRKPETNGRKVEEWKTKF